MEVGTAKIVHTCGYAKYPYFGHIRYIMHVLERQGYWAELAHGLEPQERREQPYNRQFLSVG